jgi:hypothetical protein
MMLSNISRNGIYIRTEVAMVVHTLSLAAREAEVESSVQDQPRQKYLISFMCTGV